MADEKDTQTQQEAQQQEVAVAEVPVADPVADKPKAEQTQQEVAKDAPVQQKPVQQPVAETVVVQEDDDPFDDIYAAASQAFANSRAMKAQRERELEMLEDGLPLAQAALTTARKDGQQLVSDANQRSSQMEADAQAEVARIQDAITAKSGQISKAESSDVEKARALIAVLQGYVGTTSS